MTDERMARTIAAITDVFTVLRSADGGEPDWFISFGSLLWFIRDRKLKRPFNQDIDISVRYGDIKREDLINKFREYGYKLDHELLDNYHRLPLQMTFKPTAPGLWPADVDVFFWVIGHQFAWHSYDMFNRKAPIQEEYTFKGTPVHLITAKTISMVWEEIAPAVRFPSLYGSLLDCWYPPLKDADGRYIANSGWLFPNRQYGQSKAEAMRTIKSCKRLREILP